MKKRFLILLLSIITFSIFNNIFIVSAQNEKIYLGGFPAGFSMQQRGAYVMGLSDVVTNDGIVSPSKCAGIESGDILLSIDEKEVNSSLDIANCLKNGRVKKIELLKGDEIKQIEIIPAKDTSGEYKLGLFVRDNINGIGTITFIKGNKFASLGHPVLDENGKIVKLVQGNLFECNITNVIKGQKGNPGELRGVFLRKTCVANIDKNLNEGVYGTINRFDIVKNLTEIEIGKIQMGEAKIYTTINGNTPKAYSILIVKSENFKNDKNVVIKITDKELLDATGGIVQGMSGSPIVQNGKLVGAVTHVFVNDPRRGFGISIQNMISNIN